MKPEIGYDLSVLAGDCSLPCPTSPATDHIESVRVKKLVLLDRSGTALKVTLTARDADQNSDAASFFTRGLIGRDSPIRKFLVTLAEIEFRYHAKSGTTRRVETLTLTAQGVSNLEQLSQNLRNRLDGYLRGWKIIPTTEAGDPRHCVSLLADLYDEPRRSRLRYMMSPLDREFCDELVSGQFLTNAPGKKVKTHVCPECFEQSFVLDQLTCRHCGPIDIGDAEYDVVTPNDAMVFAAIIQALGIEKRLTTVVEEHVWLIGSYKHAGTVRKFLFARQLHQASTLKKLLAAWKTSIGSAEAIVITTSDTAQLPSEFPESHARPMYFSFADNFRIVGSVWQASSPLRDLAKRVQGGFQARHGCFSENFDQVLLPAEHEPIALSNKRAAVFRYLWEHRDREIRYSDLVAVIGASRFEDIFPKKKAPDAYRVLEALVVRRKGNLQLNNDVFHLTPEESPTEG